MIRSVISALFFGNIFYGLCTVALCMETNLLAALPLNHLLFYLVAGAAANAFYTYIYYIGSGRVNPQLVAFDINNRLAWYARHRRWVGWFLILCLITIATCSVLYLVRHYNTLQRLSLAEYAWLLLFPVTGLAYSFEVLPFRRLRLLRRAGLLKPFILGFTWAGIVTVFPLLLLKAEGKAPTAGTGLPGAWLFIQNFIFISLLCILFDIKDVEQDRQRGIRTLPVRLGSRHTIWWVVLPLALVNLLLKALYFYGQPAFTVPVLVRSLPYALLLVLAFRLKEPKSTLYYLAVVDGLMLLKALTGIISVQI